MWYLQIMAHATGGTKLGIILLQAAMLVVFYAGFLAVFDILSPGDRRWHRFYAGCFAYLNVGFLTVALPLTIMTPATNWLGTLWLTVVWPVWLYGTWIGIDLETLVPPVVWGWMFN